MGDSRTILKEYPSNSVDLVVTSPPYYKLRTYGHKDEIGQEDNADSYIDSLYDVFSECKRIIKPTGSIWVNISDKINFSLLGVPERFVLMMQDQLNLLRRRTIIWHKPSILPQGDKTSFSVDFEYFYWFVKDRDYIFTTQYEPMKTVYTDKDFEYKGQALKDYEGANVQNPSNTKRKILERMKKQKIKYGGKKYPGNVDNNSYSGKTYVPNENGMRLKRCVWSIPTANFSESHFATYPEELIKTPILACTDETEHRLILDPFMGSGTTALIAQKMNRDFTGIDIIKENVNMINRRVNNTLVGWIRNNGEPI